MGSEVNEVIKMASSRKQNGCKYSLGQQSVVEIRSDPLSFNLALYVFYYKQPTLLTYKLMCVYIYTHTIIYIYIIETSANGITDTCCVGV